MYLSPRICIHTQMHHILICIPHWSVCKHTASSIHLHHLWHVCVMIQMYLFPRNYPSTCSTHRYLPLICMHTHISFGSRHTYERVMIHIWMSHVLLMIHICHLYVYACHSYVYYDDTFIYNIMMIHIWHLHMAFICVHMAFICVHMAFICVIHVYHHGTHMNATYECHIWMPYVNATCVSS